jgi:hypothetical protein
MLSNLYSGSTKPFGGKSTEDWWVTPRRKFSDIPKNITLDYKIDVFSERINGWKLDIADQLINGKYDEQGRIIAEGNPHAGYAVLDILLSYFEMIAKYQDGYLGTSESEHYFKKGIRMVFPDSQTADQNTVEKLLELLYHGTRCGMYHAGVTDTRIFLMGTENPPIFFHKGKLFINPHKLVVAIKNHFDEYISQLKDVKNSRLRQNFEKRFDKNIPTF